MARAQRIRGTVDRFAAPPTGTSQVSDVVYLRDLVRAYDGKAIKPSTDWFGDRSAWQQAGVQPGDTVLFSTNYDLMVLQMNASGTSTSPSSLKRIINSSDHVASDVVVIRRPTVKDESSAELTKQLEEQRAELDQALAAQQTLSAQQAVAGKQKQRLLLYAAVAAVLALLGGGAIGWSLASRLQQPQPGPTGVRSAR